MLIVQDKPDLSQSPPFTLADLKRAIPKHCWQKNTARSVSYLVKDVAIVAGLAVAAYSANTWWASHTKLVMLCCPPCPGESILWCSSS